MELEQISFLLILTSVGLVAGFLAALSSTAPSLILVPLLTIIYSSADYSGELTTRLALVNALAMTCVVFFATTFTHYRMGHFEEGTVILLFGGAVVGASLGVHLEPSLNQGIVLSVIAFGLICVGFAVLQRKDVYAEVFERKTKYKTPEAGFAGPVELLAIGLASGLLSATTGIGGGLVAIPLQFFLGMPVLVAIHNASLVTAFSSITALTGYLLWDRQLAPLISQLGLGELLQLATLLPAGIIGARLGVRAGHSNYRQYFRFLIGPLYILIGVYLLLQQRILTPG